MARESIITDVMLQQVYEMYSNNTTTSKMATKLFVSTSTVSNCIKKLRKNNQIKTEEFNRKRKNHKSFEMKELKEMNSLYNAGELAEDLAIKFDVSMSTLIRHIWQFRNVKTTKEIKRKKDNLAAINEFLKDASKNKIIEKQSIYKLNMYFKEISE